MLPLHLITISEELAKDIQIQNVFLYLLGMVEMAGIRMA
jgi:hypothetical protein